MLFPEIVLIIIYCHCIPLDIFFDIEPVNVKHPDKNVVRVDMGVEGVRL